MLHDCKVGFFTTAANVVGLPHLPSLKHAANGAAVVFDVEPVAHLLAVAIDGQCFARQSVADN